MNLLTIPAIISKVQTMANRALRLQIDTQEGINDEEIAKIVSNHEKYGYFCFLEEQHGDIKPEYLVDLPKLPPTDDQKKTPQQMLRDRMFVYFKEKHGEKKAKDEFNDWYIKTLDKIGQQYLDKLT
jgi:hypothetical protein